MPSLQSLLVQTIKIRGETDVAVNFGGVTFLPEDHLYADTTGIILSPEPLDLE